LKQFLSKFHLVWPEERQAAVEQLAEAETLAKESKGRVMLFRGITSYAGKITASLKPKTSSKA